MKIYLAADHAGFELKAALSAHLAQAGYKVEDVGAKKLDEDDDYPKYAFDAAIKLIAGEEDNDLAIAICGSGQGMSIAANRVRGVRAALAWDVESARAGKEDDDSNMLVLPARSLDHAQAFDMVDAWLKAEFKKDPKYKRRLDEISDIYG